MLAHAVDVPRDHVLMVIHVPDDVAVLDVRTEDLPAAWRELPYHPATQAIGDRFIAEGKALLLRLPSAITTTDKNYLLNPAHPDAARVTWKIVDPYPFDLRLFKA